jgi:signal transduction histidine kinase
MIEDFLEYARLRSPQPRNCEVRVLIEHIETLIQNRSDLSDDASLEFTPLEDDVVVHVDEELIGQVFLNLALNAFEAMDRSGKLTVAVNVRPQLLPPDVVIRFMDEGSGIDAQLVDKIFEPFFTTKTHGTGLGLPLASRVVANHGGRIRARNLDGGGAEFSVHLPLAGVLRDGHLLEGDAGLAALERPVTTQT